MKTATTTTIDVRKKAIDISIIDLTKILAVTVLMGISIFLFYKSFYVWSIGIILVSFGAVGIFRFFRELHSMDWSIDVSDLNSDDVIADLETNF